MTNFRQLGKSYLARTEDKVLGRVIDPALPATPELGAKHPVDVPLKRDGNVMAAMAGQGPPYASIASSAATIRCTSPA